MNFIWILNFYIGGLTAIAPVAISLLLPEGAVNVAYAFPFLVLFGAVAGSFIQRRLTAPPRHRITNRTSWLIFQSLLWSAVFFLVCAQFFLSAMGYQDSGQSFFVETFWINLVFGLVFGLVITAIQLDIWVRQADLRRRWMVVGSLNWSLTILMLSFALSEHHGYSNVAMARCLLISVPPTWAIHAAITHWGLPMNATPLGES